MSHILDEFYHPQAQGKIERWHQALKNHMDDALNAYMPPLTEEAITDRMRENKQLEHHQQIAGNLGGWLGASGVNVLETRDAVTQLVSDIQTTLESDQDTSMKWSYYLARDRWSGGATG